MASKSAFGDARRAHSTKATWGAGVGALGLTLAAACGGSSGATLGFGGSPDAGSTTSSTAPDASNAFDAGGATFGDDSDASTNGSCLAGLYTGNFTGNYTSSLTVIGIPVPVTGKLSLTLSETASQGELPTFTIRNGTIDGLVYSLYPFHCSMVGTLDCPNRVLVDGGVDCEYCVGAVTGDLADGGTCSHGGYFDGPLGATYDPSAHTFNGTWNGVDSQTAPDAGATQTSGVNDAGVYLGPGNYGGSGTWDAGFVDAGP